MSSEVTPGAGEHAKHGRNQLLEGILELGRNWALAVAICGAGISAGQSEIVNGPLHWEQLIFLACIMVSIMWIALAVLRFDEILARELHTRYRHLISFALIGFLMPLGGGIVVGVAKLAENREIVRICDSVPEGESSQIHGYDECIRLKAQRDALRARLESP